MDYKRVCVGLAVVFVRSNSAASEGTRKVLEIERVALFEMALVMCFGQLLNLFFLEILAVAGNKIKPNTQPVGCPGNAKHVLGAGDQGKH